MIMISTDDDPPVHARGGARMVTFTLKAVIPCNGESYGILNAK